MSYSRNNKIVAKNRSAKMKILKKKCVNKKYFLLSP